jgi:hypothetical protein
MLDDFYETRPAKRKRATKAEMNERADFVAHFTREFAPVTVRQVFYAATVNYIIEKTEDGYSKIQQSCLFGRRNGTIPYWHIADNSRSFYQVKSFQDLSNASYSFAHTYKRDFWAESSDAVEVWLEKEALAGVVSPVTNEYRIRLVPTRGFASETIVHNAINDAKNEGKSRLFIKTLYDFDRSGQDAQAAIVRRMNEIGQSMGVEVIHERLALTLEQIMELSLPTRPAKKKSSADKNWVHDFAVELDAMPPDVLRRLVSEALEPHMPKEIRNRFLQIETRERATIRMALNDLS